MDGNLSLEKMISTMASVERLVPRIGPCHIRVHPSRYKAIIDYLKPLDTDNCVPRAYWLTGVQIVQDPYVPTHRTERRRRFLTKKQRSRWHVRKYRTVEVPILGWLFEPDKISTIEWRKP